MKLSQAIARLEEKYKPGGVIHIIPDSIQSASAHLQEANHMMKIIRTQQRMIEGAKTNLIKYGEHNGECSVYDQMPNWSSPSQENPACNCGLEEALKQFESEEII